MTRKTVGSERRRVSAGEPALLVEQSGSGAGLQVTNTGSGPSLLVEDSANLDATPFVVDAAGNVGIGESSPGALLHIASSTAAIYVYGSNDSGTATRILFARSRGSAASATAVQTNDNLAQIDARGYGATGYAGGYRAALIMQAAENWTDSAQGTFLSLQTTATGGTTTSEKMRIAGNGLITGSGTSLGAWTAYTPTIGGTGWAIGDGTASGFYCQIGKLIAFRLLITFGATTTAGAGSLTITSPVTHKTATNYSKANGHILDASASKRYFVPAVIGSGSVLVPLGSSTANNGEVLSITTNAPMTWAVDDILAISGVLEAN